MPIIEEKFDQSKIDRIKNYLQKEDRKGRPRDYEILVDNFKVVPRTSDMNEFDDYEENIDDSTRNISILIYDGESNRNTKHSFTFIDRNNAIPIQPLNGLGSLGEVDNLIKQRLDEKDKDFRIQTLEGQLEAKQEQLEEAEDHIEDLKQLIEQMKTERFRINGNDLPELVGQVLSGFVKGKGMDNALNGITALFGAPKDAPAQPPGEGAKNGEEATFKEKVQDAAPSPLTDIVTAMQSALDKEQIQSVVFLLCQLLDNPTLISEVIALITNKSR